jgi:urease accessory protein
VFHGYVHGAEMPAVASALPYAAGFVAATGLLHVTGIGLGLVFGPQGGKVAPRVVQASGGAMALFGVAVLAGL